VTLSCPATSEANRGPPGVPGKRGSKGKAKQKIVSRYFVTQYSYDTVHRVNWRQYIIDIN